MPGELGSSFDPLYLPAVGRLRNLRRTLWGQATDAVRSESGETRISLALMDFVAGQVPVRYRPGVGPCLFTQPADSDGRLWVLNRMLDGTGRYGSRYTAAMGIDAQAAYTDYFTSSSCLVQDGEPVEFLDLMWSHADNLNSHAVQTPRVLELPGKKSPGLKPDRRVRLSDLKIRLNGPLDAPCLVDAKGSRLLPVYLGTMTLRLMSPVLKFLSLFGPRDLLLSISPAAPIPLMESKSMTA